MASVVSAPTAWIQDVSQLRLPSRADEHLQQLMDRNTRGELSAQEQDELTALAELSERLSLVRAEAFALLKQRAL